MGDSDGEKLNKSEKRIVSHLQKSLNDQSTRLEASIQKSEDTLNNAIKSTSDNFEIAQSVLEKRVEFLESKLAEEQKLTQSLLARIIDLENRSRRDNLVINGISEDPNEKPEACEKKVSDFIKSKLQIEDDVSIGRCHRLGSKKSATHNRPVIIKFDKFKDRQKVWGARSKLSGTKISLKENFSKETEAIRAKLTPVMNAARKQNKLAYLSVDKLWIDHKMYTIDTLDTLPDSLKLDKISTPSNHECVLFYSENSPHSNFHPAKIIPEGETDEFCHVEQYLVACKCRLAKDNDTLQAVMATTDPVEIKNLGKKVQVNEDEWETVGQEAMHKGQLAKYTQHPSLKQLLLATGDKVLGEANPHDKYWGTGLSLNHPNAFKHKEWPGKNQTGKILTNVRTAIK